MTAREAARQVAAHCAERGRVLLKVGAGAGAQVGDEQAGAGGGMMMMMSGVWGVMANRRPNHACATAWLSGTGR